MGDHLSPEEDRQFTSLVGNQNSLSPQEEELSRLSTPDLDAPASGDPLDAEPAIVAAHLRSINGETELIRGPLSTYEQKKDMGKKEVSKELGERAVEAGQRYAAHRQARQEKKQRKQAEAARGPKLDPRRQAYLDALKHSENDVIESPSHYPHSGKLLPASASPDRNGDGGDGGDGGDRGGNGHAGGTGGGGGGFSEVNEKLVSGILPDEGHMSIQEFLVMEPEDPNSPEWQRWRLGCFMESEPMRYFIIILVILNGIIIGCETDQRFDEPVVGYLFVIIFVMELLAKLYAFRFAFWTEPWNVFDFIIICVAILEVFLALAMGGTDLGLSIFRLMRIFRVLRLIVFVDRLNNLVEAFLTALKSVVWVVILLGLVLYMFAVVAQGLFGKNSTLLAKVPETEEYWSTVPRSMATLIQITTLDNWSTIARPIGAEYWWAWIFLILWVCVAAIGLMNLIMAVFIDALFEQTKKQEDAAKEKHVERKNNALRCISELFHQYDDDDSGTLDKEEMNFMFTLFEDEDFEKKMNAAGLSVQQIKKAIEQCMYEAPNGEIGHENFLNAIATMDDSSTKKEAWELSNRIQALDVIANQNGQTESETLLQAASSARAKVKAMEASMKEACAKATAELEAMCVAAEARG